MDNVGSNESDKASHAVREEVQFNRETFNNTLGEISDFSKRNSIRLTVNMSPLLLP